MTFRLQEPKAPFQNATSRDWQKAFNPQRELGAFCSGVKSFKIMERINDSNTNYVSQIYTAVGRSFRQHHLRYAVVCV
jgi:hypothetical protein